MKHALMNTRWCRGNYDSTKGDYHGYTVIHVTNTAHRSERHPPQVVYQGDNGHTWSVPLDKWPGSLVAEGDSMNLIERLQHAVLSNTLPAELQEDLQNVVDALQPLREYEFKSGATYPPDDEHDFASSGIDVGEHAEAITVYQGAFIDSVAEQKARVLRDNLLRVLELTA